MRALLLVLALVSPAFAGWRHDCRQQMKDCRLSQGASIAPPTTTTTLPTCYQLIQCETCNPADCCYFLADGRLYCPIGYGWSR